MQTHIVHDPQPPTRDPDLNEQARPGHGVPSQDPDASAQFPIEASMAREQKHTVYMGAGVVGGVIVGAAMGWALGGPLGVFIGATVGAVAGALAGAAAGMRSKSSMQSARADEHWRHARFD